MPQESRLDLPRLLADPAALALPPALLQTLRLLRAAPPRSGSWLVSLKGVSVASSGEAPGHGTGQGAGGRKGGQGQKGGKGQQDDGLGTGEEELAASYLGALLALVARARRQGSRTTLLQAEAEVR